MPDGPGADPQVYMKRIRGSTMREKVGERPYELSKSGGRYTIKFYPLKKGAKDPDRVLFTLDVTKDEFAKMAAKIK
ncbi:MAG: hypothetical protein MPK62_02655 [Alphaproteobacteria bacterium]|nr:hypothetical protein [Alphaproteobacteria bacterium]